MRKCSIREALEVCVVGDSVCIQGWVRTRRDSKEFSFLEVNDGSCFSSIQIIAQSSLNNYCDVLRAATGASVSVHGTLVESPGKEQRVEVHATEFFLIGENGGEAYPLQKKRHTNEFLRTIAHLRPRTNTFGAVFRVRSACSFAIHKFFTERGFINLHSPIITTSDCEGAGQMFQVTTIDIDRMVREKTPINYESDFFGRRAHLTVSGQLEAETYASALSKVYTFGPTFRAENSNTPRHLAEFWMIEPEMAFCDLKGDMEVAEDFIKFIIGYILDNCHADMAFFDQWIEKDIIKSLDFVRNSKFEHLTYTEAVHALENSGRAFEFPVSWGCDLQTEHERYLTEEFVKRPVFITNYPKEIKAFYMKLDEGEKTVSAMDLLVPRLGEIIGGSQREEKLDILQRRVLECGLSPDDYEWYFDLRRFGTVPHAGFGLGFERMIMYLTGMANIRDVIPFPRTPGNAAF